MTQITCNIASHNNKSIISLILLRKGLISTLTEAELTLNPNDIQIKNIHTLEEISKRDTEIYFLHHMRKSRSGKAKLIKIKLFLR